MRTKILAISLLMASAVSVFAHVGTRASIHDTVAGVINRMRETLSPEDLKGFNAARAVEFLTEDEKQILGNDYLYFEASVPVAVHVIRDVRLGDEPFWLAARGFKKGADLVKAGDRAFDVWSKDFDAGEIGLGVNSLSGNGEHYFVAVQAQKKRDEKDLEVENIYPGQHTVAILEPGARPYSDDDATVQEVPEKLAGALLIRGVDERRRDARIVGVFRTTDHPSSAAPDHVVLTWTGDPRTTQTIQWRTGTGTPGGAIVYAKKGAAPLDTAAASPITAVTRQLVQPTLVNDPVVHWHTVTLSGLEPSTTYSYAVGDGKGQWRAAAEFTTAPADNVPFSFFYMGDAQNGLDTWGNLIDKSFAHRPDAAFYIMAGDLVDRGAERDDWDKLFANAEGIWDRRQVVPVPGNHEYQGGNPQWYLDQFALPESSPMGELNYTIRYSNALFIMLDSNRSIGDQAAWLEEQLANTDATWKIAVYHHPAYSSGLNRDNKAVRELWGALFDKYHVDLALQGHDHAYLRTYPMRNQQRVDSPADGTIYIVSVSGTKFYEQGQFAYTQFGMTNVSTYQVLDIKIDGNRLEYGAFDVDGQQRDTFVIQK